MGDSLECSTGPSADDVTGLSREDLIQVDRSTATGAHSLSGGEGDDLIAIAHGDTATGGETWGDTLDGTWVHLSGIERIICFVAGTRVATPGGARRVETLRPGDLAVTRDHGLQPIRWAGARTIAACGRLGPVGIRPDVVAGPESDLLVSTQHRMLFQRHRAELLFGEREMLVPARHLVDGHAVTEAAGGMVTYVHILFDTHEIVDAEGAATESFHPGEIAVDAAAREQPFAVFPSQRSLPTSYGRTARRSLRGHEARLITAQASQVR